MTAQMTAFDIGEKGIKIAVFSKGALTKTLYTELPDNMVANGSILSMDAMAEFISETAKTHGLTKKDAGIVLPTSMVYTRTVTIPLMSEEQLKLNLPYEFKDYLTEDKAAYLFDYEVLETITNEEGEPTEQRLFVCATLKSTLAKYQEMFEKAGYDLSLVIPEEYAYAKLCRGDMGNTDVSDKAIAIVELGHLATRVHLINKGEYDSKRIIDVGMADLENVVARISDSDLHVAHNYTVSNYNNVLAEPACYELYNHLGVEILKSVNFFNFNNRDLDISDIYLAGGGAGIPALRSTIAQVTNVNIHTLDELFTAEYSSEQPTLFFMAICCGAKE